MGDENRRTCGRRGLGSPARLTSEQKREESRGLQLRGVGGRGGWVRVSIFPTSSMKVKKFLTGILDGKVITKVLR